MTNEMKNEYDYVCGQDPETMDDETRIKHYEASSALKCPFCNQGEVCEKKYNEVYERQLAENEEFVQDRRRVLNDWTSAL